MEIGASESVTTFSLKGKLVKNQRGPATVNGSSLYFVTVYLDGKT